MDNYNEILEAGLVKGTKNGTFIWHRTESGTHRLSINDIKLTIVDNRGHCEACCEPIVNNKCDCEFGPVEGDILLDGQFTHKYGGDKYFSLYANENRSLVELYEAISVMGLQEPEVTKARNTTTESVLRSFIQ